MYFPIIDVLKENFIAKIPSIVTKWLTDNVDPVGSAVVVDTSLSISGAAADAKITGDLKSDLGNTETEVNTIGQFIGKGIIPIVKTGLYYTGTAGHAYQMTENSNSVYIDPVDVSKLIGKKLTISLDGTNDGSRVFGFCNENGIIDTAYTEAGTRSMFALRDGRYVADFTITGKFFFFSYAKFTSPTPQFVIPSETLVYTKSEIDAKETAACKKAHISFDDCLFWTDLIDNENTYTSAFDNAFLSDLKSIHDATKAVFTLNCFCSTTGYDISDVPAKFATDFQQNSDWLKFSFHAEDRAATYTADNVAAITTSYNKFIASIYTMTGNVDSIDTVVRLDGFTGSLNNVLAIRDANTGITGLLTADDTRVSYYFDTDTNNFMIAHGKMFDAANQLVLIHSQLRLESVSNITTFCEQYLTPAYGNYVKNLEFFTHEYEWNSTMKTKVNSLIKWLQENKYDFDYWM